MANFEAFFWNFSSSTILEIGRSVKCIPAGFQWVPDSMKNWFCLFDLEMCDSFQKKFLAILLIRNGYCELVFLLTLLASSQCSITTKVTEYIWKKHWMHWKFCAKAKNHAKNKELTSTVLCKLYTYILVTTRDMYLRREM